MSKPDKCLLTGALLRAINWEETAADGAPEDSIARMKSLQLAARYKALLKKINPHYRDPLANTKMASIFDLAREPKR